MKREAKNIDAMKPTNENQPMTKIIVPVSGGKDSQVCLKLAISLVGADAVIGLFCDTKFEHPATYAHIIWMEKFYGVEIITITNGCVPEEVLKVGYFPSGKARFCTDRLKIRPSSKFYQEFAEMNGGFEVWYGMRSDESRDREERYRFKTEDTLYPPHEVLGSYPKRLEKLGVSFRLPVLDWATQEIYDYLGDEMNPLYEVGFDRVGCFPCLAAGDRTKRRAFEFDETGRRHWELVQDLERQVGEFVYRSAGRGLHKGEKEGDFQGCAICAI